MLQTELIQPYLVPKTEQQNREEIIKSSIKEIRPLNPDVIKLKDHKKKNFYGKLKASITTEPSTNIFCFSFILMLFFLFHVVINDKTVSSSISVITITSLVVVTFGSIMINALYRSFSSLLLTENELETKEKENMKKIIELFSALSDKKFEIRGEFLEDYSKLKLIIEENQYIEGTTSVIKTSSKSLTAYINMTEDKDSILRSIVSIVKESEKKFN